MRVSGHPATIPVALVVRFVGTATPNVVVLANRATYVMPTMLAQSQAPGPEVSQIRFATALCSAFDVR
jgi:hypothetical protein